jgi:hypothetical protein
MVLDGCKWFWFWEGDGEDGGDGWGMKRVARIGRGKINCKYWHSFGQSGWENCGHKKVGLAFKKKEAHCRIFLKYVKIKKHIFFNIFGHDPKLFLLDRDRTGH